MGQELALETGPQVIEGEGPELTLPDTGDLERDLTVFLRATFRTLSGSESLAPILRGLMAEAQLDPEFLARFRVFIEARRALVRARLQSARELALDAASVDVAVDMIFGAMWYRMLLEHAPTDAATARRVAQLVAGMAGGE